MKKQYIQPEIKNKGVILNYNLEQEKRIKILLEKIDELEENVFKMYFDQLDVFKIKAHIQYYEQINQYGDQNKKIAFQIALREKEKISKLRANVLMMQTNVIIKIPRSEK
jgi:hypothetical protein